MLNLSKQEERQEEQLGRQNDCFVAKTTEIERGSFGGVEVWRSIRDLLYNMEGEDYC